MHRCLILVAKLAKIRADELHAERMNSPVAVEVVCESEKRNEPKQNNIWLQIKIK